MVKNIVECKRRIKVKLEIISSYCKSSLPLNIGTNGFTCSLLSDWHDDKCLRKHDNKQREK